jgi:cell division protein FtsA
METPIAVLDIGTTKTCALVGETSETGALRILGVGIAPSGGMRKGVVVDVKQATHSIVSALDQAQRAAGVGVEAAYVGIAGAHISSTNSRGVAAVGHNARGVTQDDMDRAMEAAEAIAVPPNREIVHAIARGYTLDGQDGIRDPLGMVGYRLEVEAHIVTGATASIQNLVKAIEGAGVHVLGLVLEPIAAGESVLTSAEKEMGVVLADIGGGTTDIAIFIEGSVWHTVVLPTGGMHVTNDLAVGLRTPFDAAEEIKLKYGHCAPETVDENDLIDVAAFGDEGRRTISRKHVAEIIRARADEFLNMILVEIKRSGYDGLLPAGIVLCGGTADLTGLRQLAREILDTPVRIGAPRDLEGLTDRISSPAFATSTGLVAWGLKQAETRRLLPPNGKNKRRGDGKSALTRIGDLFKPLLPD